MHKNSACALVKFVTERKEQTVKKKLALLLSVVMLLSMLTACGGSSSGGNTASEAQPKSSAAGDSATEAQPTDDSGIPPHKEELIIGTTADINNLNLQKQQDAVNNIVLKLTHETLIFFTNEGTIEPRLCTGWEYLDDTHIRFKLHDGITFSDGSPLTAEDVKFTYDMGLENGLSMLNGLVETKVIDPLTVELVIESYSNEFLISLSSVPLSIQSKKAYESGMDEPYLIGSGPYKLDKWEPDEYVTFVKNENYWGDKKGISDRITFRPIKEASTRAIALQNGEIDVCIDPSIDNLPDLEADENVTVFQRPGTRLFYLGFNVQQAPWDNLKLRQAVAHAIDRQAIVDTVLAGKGKTQTTILNRGLWSFYDEMEGYPYDVEKAKALLAESGYTPSGKLPILISNESDYSQVAQMIQAMLKEIGLDIEIQVVEPATLKTECNKGTQGLFLWRWNEDSKVDFVYRDLYYTGSPSNYHHFSDPRADELTDLVLTEKDPEKRLQYSQELQTYLVEQCPQVPLYIKDLVIAYNKNLQGTYLYGGGNHDWRFAYVAQ